LIAGSGRSVFAGFTALFLLLASVAALTPSVLRALARLASRALAGFSSVGRLALEDVAASLSRTGVAVAALGMAVAAMIGVSIMVESFRVSLRHWLEQTMRADIYIAAPGPGVGRPERRLEPAVLDALIATPGVADHSASRSVIVHSSRSAIALDALHLAPGSYAGIDLTAGDPQTKLSRVTATEASELIKNGSASGGMIPKLQSIIALLERGVHSAHIISGTKRNALLSEIFTDKGTGTMVHG